MDFGYFLRRFDYECHIDPDTEAVVFENERITYRELRDRGNQFAQALLSLDVSKGDRVAVLLRNCAEWFDIFFGIASLGAVMVPVNFLLKSKEVEFILIDSGASILVVGEDLLGLVDLHKENTPELREVICIGKGASPSPVLSFEELTRKAKDVALQEMMVQTEDLFILQYTSGTTGFPKGVMHTQGAVLWNSFHQIGDFNVTENERYLCVPGLCWAAGLHDFTLPTLWMGGTVILMPSGGLDIANLLTLIEKEQITKVLLVPTILKQFVDYPDLSPDRVESLDVVLTGAESVPVTVIEKFNLLLPGSTLLQGYGLSEGPTIALYLKEKDAIRKIGSTGKPSTNCELIVADDSMEKVPPGVKGEILIRSPATMVGYWKQPEATLKAFEGGWLHTGDLAEYDGEGFIYITGRKKDMYISGGLNVYPAEIENVILKDPDVLEAAVIATHDEKWGEVGCAVLVPREEQEIDIGRLKRLCSEELAGYKVPKRYIIRKEALPKTASGKIKKFELV